VKRKGVTSQENVKDPYADGKNPLLEDFASESAEHMRLLQRLIYVNGEVGEVTEESGRLNLR
jgi:hypothetical protein